MYRRFESRFLDGTAAITLAELQKLWPSWNEDERLDFCRALACGADVTDVQSILRFLIMHSDRCVRSTIALNVAMRLPAEEAVLVLKGWCLADEIGQCANYFQALALTKDIGVLDFLRSCFRRIWNNEGLMARADFQNWMAFDAVCCLKEMLALGENAGALRSAYETLREHPDGGTQKQTEMWLSEYFEPRSDGET
jgi:hypothetical protein